MNYTPQEKQAQKLWAGYESQNEERFWEEYTSLLKDTALIKSTHKASQPAKLPLYSNKKNYTGQLQIIPIAALLITGMYGIGFNDIAHVFLVFWIVLFIVIVSEILSHTSFEISPTSLRVHKTFEKNTAVIPWETVEEICIKQVTFEEKGNTYDSKDLEINFYDQGRNQVLVYDYNLPEKEQQSFFYHLRQYIKQVHTS